MSNAIALPKKCEPLRVDAHGKTLVVKKHAPGSYYLRVEGLQRTRWGNADEVREDIRHFIACGNLPGAREGWS